MIELDPGISKINFILNDIAHCYWQCIVGK